MIHYSRTLTSEAHYDDRSCARPLFRPAFWFRIAVADPGGGGGGGGVTGMITPPPPWTFPILKMQCPRGGGGVLVNVQVQEWGCFSIFRRADQTSRGQCPRGVGCLWMSSPPPPFRKSCIRAWIWIGTPPPPKKALPYFAHWHQVRF